MLALIVALAIAGCGGDDENEASTTAPTTTHASTTSTKPHSNKPGSKKSASKKSGSKKSGSKKSGSKQSGSSEKAKQPTTPPEGTPVGTVPPGAGPAADADAVVRTVSAYLRSIARGDGPQACAQLTPDAQRAVERKVARAAPETKGSPCDASIVLYQSSYRSAAGVRVTDVRVAGDHAKAVAFEREASLVKHGRTWLIARYEL